MTVLEPRPDDDEIQRRHVRSLLATDWWFWRLLWDAKFWTFLVPYPLPEVLRLFPSLRRHFHADFKKPWTESSIWPTLAILAFYFRPRLERLDEQIALASEAGKAMLTATLLIATMLSLSVALPGQTVLKPFTAIRPRAISTFGVPFLWSLLWGLSGGGILLSYRVLPPRLMPWATGFGYFAATAVLAPLFFVVRLYLLGLLAISEEESQKRKKAEAQREEDRRLAEEAASRRESDPSSQATAGDA